MPDPLGRGCPAAYIPGTRMRRGLQLLSFAVGVCAMLAVGSAWAEDPPPPAPRLEVATPTIDLGEVIRGRTEPVVFELRNAGDAPLTILRAKPG